MLNKELIDSLRQINSPAVEPMEQLLAFDQADAAAPKVRVAAMGLYNGGKSTLLNALADRFENEYFPTACVRETRQLKTLDLDDYVLLDTPGLDAEDVDDAVAFDGLLAADLVLLVHNLKLGELDVQELEYLERLKESSSLTDGLSLLCVLTRGEGRREGFTETEETIKGQIHAVTGHRPDTFVVSSTTYLEGGRKQQPAFIEVSGIPELRGCIHKRVADLTLMLQQSRAERRAQLADRARCVLTEESSRQAEQLAAQREALAAQLRDVNQIANALRTAWREVLTSD